LHILIHLSCSNTLFRMHFSIFWCYKTQVVVLVTRWKTRS
jgi:hypothetical protein